MGNSHSVEFQYIRLLKQLFRSSGMKRTFLRLLLPLCLRQERTFQVPVMKGHFLMMIKIGSRLANKMRCHFLNRMREISDILSKCLLWIDDQIGSIRLDAEEKWLGFLLILLGEASLIGALLAPPEEKGDLWKLMAALKKINAWVGHMVNKSGNHSLTFYKNVTRYTRSYVKLPYILLKEPAVWNETQGIIIISFNISTESLYLLRARTGLWLPVNLGREWQESLPMAVLQYLTDALKRSKRFVGMLITAVMGIIAITATATVAGVALKLSIQTIDYITD
ncbi:hypothetical protein EI555_008795 [Monodon monoceros]|uniref:Uncharacterized protein n=1 Tax=Monodon monoceros TaxID=40151 RepID=A0A4U1EJ16_MONMO|nr:hypothetical protein EI555_008795 [Monodon monoceros]